MMPGQAHRKAKMLISIFSFIIGCLLNIALLLLLFGPVTLRLISNLSHGLIDRQTSNVAGLVAAFGFVFASLIRTLLNEYFPGRFFRHALGGGMIFGETQDSIITADFRTSLLVWAIFLAALALFEWQALRP